MKRRLRVLGLIALACAASACTPEVVGRMRSLDARAVLESGPIAEAEAIAASYGKTLGGTAFLLLGIYLWYQAMKGKPWVGILQQLGPWTLLWLWMQSTAGGAFGLERWIYEAGTYLGDRFGVRDSVFEQKLWGVVIKLGERIVNLGQSSSWGEAGLKLLEAEAVAKIILQPAFALAITANSMGIWLIRQVANLAFVFLVGFYSMVFPLVAWTVVLPQTRNVFTGWLRSYISVALWPFFFAMFDRLAVALPLATWLGSDVGGDPLSQISAIAQGTLVFFVLNVVTVLVYIAIPVASRRIVAGMTSPILGSE